MNEFLNPKSMVTPGVAGGLVMLLTNTCASQFDLPAKWAALILSGLITFFVVAAASGGLLQKALFWLLNSLIIFSMAMGTNQAAINLAKESPTGPIVVSTPTPAPSATPKPKARPPKEEPKPFFHQWIGEESGGSRGRK
jgi:hypothetical protein